MKLVPLPEDVEAFVRETFVLPASDVRSGVRVDLIFSTTPYEVGDRKGRARSGGRLVPIASAEDLILHKLFAGRPRDLEDARGVILRKRRARSWPKTGSFTCWRPVYYRVEPRGMKPLIDWIAHYRAFWKEYVDRLEQLLEKIDE